MTACLPFEHKNRSCLATLSCFETAPLCPGEKERENSLTMKSWIKVFAMDFLPSEGTHHILYFFNVRNFSVLIFNIDALIPFP